MNKYMIMFIGFIIFSCALLALFIHHPFAPEPPIQEFKSVTWQPIITNEERLYTGRLNYKLRCSKCHGMDAQGRGRAPGLNQPLWKDIKHLDIYHKIVRDGIPNTIMKGFRKELRPEDIESIVAYIHTLNSAKKVKETKTP